MFLIYVARVSLFINHEKVHTHMHIMHYNKQMIYIVLILSKNPMYIIERTTIGELVKQRWDK